MGWLASYSLLPVVEVSFQLQKEQLEFYRSPALEAGAAWMSILYRDDRSLEESEHPRVVDRTSPQRKIIKKILGSTPTRTLFSASPIKEVTPRKEMRERGKEGGCISSLIFPKQGKLPVL